MQLIESMVDTACWSAIFRAEENERSDALFRDRWARELAGERGARILKAIPLGPCDSWSPAVRTHLIDRMVMQCIEREGVDLVLNLGAGYCMRPYRMFLPKTLRWIEADFPTLIEEKNARLASQEPACRLERVGLDIRIGVDRRALLNRLGGQCKRGMVITEALLFHFTAGEIGEIGGDLAGQGRFAFWTADIMNPAMLVIFKYAMNRHLESAGADLHFAPAGGPGFFRRMGWEPREAHSIFREAARLRRLCPWLRGVSLAPDAPPWMPFIPWMGACLFGRPAANIGV